jgi:hypothetical protein
VEAAAPTPRRRGGASAPHLGAPYQRHLHGAWLCGGACPHAPAKGGSALFGIPQVRLPSQASRPAAHAPRRRERVLPVVPPAVALQLRPPARQRTWSGEGNAPTSAAGMQRCRPRRWRAWALGVSRGGEAPSAGVPRGQAPLGPGRGAAAPARGVWGCSHASPLGRGAGRQRPQGRGEAPHKPRLGPGRGAALRSGAQRLRPQGAWGGSPTARGAPTPRPAAARRRPPR